MQIENVTRQQFQIEEGDFVGRSECGELQMDVRLLSEKNISAFQNGFLFDETNRTEDLGFVIVLYPYAPTSFRTVIKLSQHLRIQIVNSVFGGLAFPF